MAQMKIMISHASDEKDLAEAWKELLEAISAQSIDVWFSSDLRGTGGMTPGEDWRRNLERRISESNVILAIQTPSSSTHAWIIWECGFAHGIYVNEMLRKHHSVKGLFSGVDSIQDHGVIPVVYVMKRGDLSNSLNTFQVYEGGDPAQVRQICEYLLTKAGLELDGYIFEKAVAAYSKAIEAFHPRQQVTVEQIKVWHARFQKLLEAGRGSEVPNTRLRMYTSLLLPFEPVEPEIHEMLSQVLIDQGYYNEAIQEINYALRLLHDDTDLLYRKALAEVELQNLQSAEKLVKLLLSLDPQLATDPEIASLEGRIQRERWMLTQDPVRLDEAIAAYHRAYTANPGQYYPGINLAELLLIKGDASQAEHIFHQLLDTCQKYLTEQVVSYWVDFTLGTIYLGLEDSASALVAYQRGMKRIPTPSSRHRKSALKGAKRMAEAKKMPGMVANEIERLLL